MHCANDNAIGSDEFLARFNAEVARTRTPLSGGIDLTERCNLRCKHCYLGPGADASCEMSSELALSIIDQSADAGCLFFLITGGEPMLRADFADVYRRAKERGMFVTVFTNATLVDDATCSLFRELPPRSVEVTIYGASSVAHDAVTAAEGSFELTMAGVRMLTESNVKVALKTIMMKENAGEFAAMELLAAEVGADFRMDAMVFPRLSGDAAPLAYHVPADDAVEMELSDETRLEGWTNYARRADSFPSGGMMYDCGTGVNCFHVSASGILHPCLMARDVGYDLGSGSFSKGWAQEIPKIREIPAAEGSPCGSCGKRGACSFCPASFELGTDGPMYREYACEVAEKRFERIKETA